MDCLVKVGCVTVWLDSQHSSEPHARCAQQIVPIDAALENNVLIDANTKVLANEHYIVAVEILNVLISEQQDSLQACNQQLISK